MATTVTASSRPDEGYAWVIVASCAFIQFALFGIFRSAGLLYVAILHTFGVSREVASWPFTMCSALSDLAGLIMSMLTRFMSIRTVALIGSAIATLGIALCHQAESMMWINVCFGFVHGIGVGIVTALVPIVIDRYFKSHKTTALGLSFSGVSVSCFILPPFIECFLHLYGLQGLFLMLSGVVMNTLVASALLRDPPWLTETKETYEQISTIHRSEKSMDTERLQQSQLPEVSRLYYETETNMKSVAVPCESGYFPCAKLNGQKYSSLPSLSTSDSRVDDSERFLINDYSEMKSNDENEGATLCDATGDGLTPLCSCNDQDGSSNEDEPSFGSGIRTAVANAKDLLSRKTFYIIAFSSAVFYLLFISFLVVIVDYAVDEGVDEMSAIYIMSTFGLIDMFGRSGLGWLVDRGFIESKNQFVINSIAIGLMFQLYPFATNLFHFCAIAGIHGLFSGSSITLLYILQAEFAGTEKMSLIVGLVHFCNGLVSFARPPIIGIFRDCIGSYDWMFRLMGFLSFLVAALWLLEAWASKKFNSLKVSKNQKEVLYEKS